VIAVDCGRLGTLTNLIAPQSPSCQALTLTLSLTLTLTLTLTRTLTPLAKPVKHGTSLASLPHPYQAPVEPKEEPLDPEPTMLRALGVKLPPRPLPPMLAMSDQPGMPSCHPSSKYSWARQACRPRECNDNDNQHAKHAVSATTTTTSMLSMP
jgi:hypothetical protein